VRYLTAVLLLAACATAPQAPEPADLDIRATVIAEYNVISGPAGRRDWNVFKELFTPDAKIDEVVSEMAEHKFGAAVVLQNGKVVGVFTTIDAMRAFGELLQGRLAS